MSVSPRSAEQSARESKSRPTHASASTAEAASLDQRRDEEQDLNDVLGLGGADCAMPRWQTQTSLRLLDLPQMEESIPKDPAVAQVMEDVLNHYGVSQCVLTWRHAGRLHFMARPGEEISSTEVKSETQLFNHTISRKLPIIVNDAVCTSLSLPDHICRPGFYSAVPLAIDEMTFIGTLCIVDAVSNPSFMLGDADHLVKKGAELVVALRSSVNFSKTDAVGSSS